MSDLYWPGDDRAGEHFGQEAFVRALVDVEEDWLARLGHPADLQALVQSRDLEVLAREAERGGNPVIGLVDRLRDGLTGEPASWLHRGLTSQDVVDSALVRMAERAAGDLRADLAALGADLTALAQAHRDTPMVARTLTQHAVPTTFGLRVAQWLAALVDADEQLSGLSFPDQVGGAAGTRAAMVELGVEVDLEPLPWHTVRAPVTRLGDALVTTTDALARIANDVLVMSRPEIGELSEGRPGGSSTMPGKANPVLSVLVRRAALTTPQLAATLHVGAASQVDDRADGGWHAEWATVRDLVRRTLTAASQSVELVAGLQVHAERMAATLAAAGASVRAEQRAMTDLTGRVPLPSYDGQAGAIVDAVVLRAQRHWRSA
ncbi:lyase family protein [Nocardioides sp.]|uniref:lyase family protein n=1 Tax=Nocardioides sp. TaxID=35761 RepID=UPI00260B81C3|nr:lyase family protein [Nocardioides sp.]MCW2737317.1 3-carboxy-cis,cis-muconate cycloisomerase [Nocardioides sp.]